MTGTFSAKAPRWSKRLPTISGWTLGLALVGLVAIAAYLLGRTDSEAALSGKTGQNFFNSISPPVWIILLINLATLISSVAGAFAAFKIAPETALKVADTQAGVAREAVAVAGKSADAASRSAEASLVNAAAASRTSGNLGVHAVARLRQEWINDLRGRVAEAHALLSNWRPLAPKASAAERDEHGQRSVQLNEVVARIELLLNPGEPPSQVLLEALRTLEAARGDSAKQRTLGPPVIAAAQLVLKAEWDRVRAELRGDASASTPAGAPTRA